MNYNRFIGCLFILSSSTLFGCGTKKNVIKYEEVLKGNQLEKIAEIPFDSFLITWVQKTDDERGPTLWEIYKDSVFTYFLKRRPEYYKIRNNSLQLIDYKRINGDSIRNKFYNEIIPFADIEKQKNCSSTLIDFDFEYFYLETEKAFRIECHYKVLCEFVFPIVNKHYSAKYYIDNNTIENLTLAKSKKIK